MAKRKATRRPDGDGQVYKDGEKYRAALQVGIDPVTGQPRYRSMRCDSHAEAVKAVDRLKKERDDGKAPQAERGTLSQHLDEWLEKKIKPFRAPNTYRQYRWVVEQHITPILGRKRFADVTHNDVQDLIAAKRTQQVAAKSKDKPKSRGKVTPEAAPCEKPKGPRPTLSRSTLRIIRAILSSAYSDAMEAKLADYNPAAKVELPTSQKKKPVFLWPEEAAKLVEGLRGSELGTLLRFMLATGTRIGEATGIRWEDIDLERRQVHIRGQLQRVKTGGLAYRPATKTNEDRTIPLSANIAKELAELKASLLIDELRDPDGIVFLNAEGRRVDAKYAAIRLKEACAKAGIKPVSPHKLRHTAATLALAATGNTHAVQKLLGHSQASTTTDIYGHATAETLRPVADALDRILSQGA